MASQTQSFFWKMREFEAHSENVNCLALGPLGHNFGHVIATGGDDHKVNLWSIKESNKLSQVMNLCGHTSPVDCIQFNVTAEFLCSGSRVGEIKIYNLETNKLIRTLIGHQDGVRCMDFNPWGDFLVSGSSDCNIRLWDCRKRGSIFSYPSHKARINSVKFSPDGQWIATGGDDCAIKIWDLRVLRVLKEFNEHVNSVTCVKFHPQEFLLASGSTDRSVKFYDLESFQLVSTERELSSVRCLSFNQDGDCLFVGARNHLKVVGWEPSRLFDSVSVNWDRVCDIRATNNELFGASFHLNKVALYAVDLSKVKPFANRGYWSKQNNSSSPSKDSFSANTSLRKSFSKTERPVSLKSCRPSTGSLLVDGRTIEESTSGTDPEDNEVAIANIINLTDYNEIFKGNRTLNRTPPPDTFVEPPVTDTSTHRFIDATSPQIIAEFNNDEAHHNFDALSLDPAINYCRPTFTFSPKTTQTMITSPPRDRPPVLNVPNKSPSSPYNRSKSNLDTVYNRSRRNDPIADSTGVTKHQLNRNKRDDVGKFNIQRQSSYKDSNQQQICDNLQMIPNNLNQTMRLCTSEANLNVKEINIVSDNSTVAFSHTPTNFRNIAMSSCNSSNSVNTAVNRSTVISNRRSNIGTTLSPAVDIYLNQDSKQVVERQWSEQDGGDSVDVTTYIPTTLDRPAGLDMDDFIPQRCREMYDFRSNARDDVIVSEAEALSVVMRGHEQVLALLITRQRNLKLAMMQGRTKDCKGAVEMAISLNDMGVLVDLLIVYNKKYTLWNLDLCATVLPKVQELIQSKYETYINTGCESLKLILRNFGSVIKTNVQNPVGSFGIDIPREERYRKSVKCQEHFDGISAVVLKKQSLSGNLGNTFKELKSMFKNILD